MVDEGYAGVGQDQTDYLGPSILFRGANFHKDDDHIQWTIWQNRLSLQL